MFVIQILQLSDILVSQVTTQIVPRCVCAQMFDIFFDFYTHKSLFLLELTTQEIACLKRNYPPQFLSSSPLEQSLIPSHRGTQRPLTVHRNWPGQAARNNEHILFTEKSSWKIGFLDFLTTYGRTGWRCCSVAEGPALWGTPRTSWLQWSYLRAGRGARSRAADPWYHTVWEEEETLTLSRNVCFHVTTKDQWWNFIKLYNCCVLHFTMNGFEASYNNNEYLKYIKNKN